MQLFDDLLALPQGFVYRPDFLSVAEERTLLADIRAQDFHEIRMHGVVARRKVIQYGWKYAFDGARLARAPRSCWSRVSAYVLAGPARTVWEHSIPAVGMLRYSITFRTLEE